LNRGKNLSFLNEDYFKQNTSILIQETNSFLKDKGIDLEDYLSDINLFSVFNFDSFKTILNSVINIFSQITIGIFSTLFITFFLLKENNILNQLVRNIINEKHQQNALNSAIAIKRMLSRYFIGLLIQIGILFLFYWITLSILGIPNASVIALLCALLNLIPYVGPLIGIFFNAYAFFNRNYRFGF
jgi:predicted PurR-regulated permease PerM